MHSFADSEETLNIVAMDNKFSQTHYSFKFVRTYMEMLEQLTLKAWNSPSKLTVEEVSQVRDLCSLTKCEASVWYLLLRARKERQREEEDGVTGLDVSKTLSMVREYKLIHRSDKLIHFYGEHLKDYSCMVQHFHALRYEKKVDDEQELRARKILTMSSELARLFENDAAFIFYLETGLTKNAFRLLSARPLYYRSLIEQYIELDRLKGRQTDRVNLLKKGLERELARHQPRERQWWNGTDEQWRQFVDDCVSRGWLCADADNRPYDNPYMLSDECCHIQFLRYVVRMGFKGMGVKPLRPGDERHEDDGRISCKQLAEELTHTFCCKFTAGQVSNARKDELEGEKRQNIQKGLQKKRRKLSSFKESEKGGKSTRGRKS